MTCREFADFMADFLSGELPPSSRAAFEHHLRLCVNCQRYLAGYEETVKLGKAAFANDDAAVPPHVPEELVQGVLSFLAERGYPDAQAVHSAEESLIFALPKELRRDLKAAAAKK